MNNFISTRCQDCGGQLKQHKFGVLKCEKCNNIIQLSHSNDLDKLNKANNLRLNKKFAESLELYREILSMDEQQPEANWGAFLSQYGIDYVSDNNKLIPTIYRPLYNYSFLDDNYIVNLLNSVSGEEHKEYLDRIHQLEQLRLQIESKKYEKFDIFISCKITIPDIEEETKTPEYEWGKQIYDSLNSPNLKVFFSPKSLPSTNSAYEPIIYSALQSAKYLIILASEADYLESTWIKNESSRFLDIKKISNTDKYVKLVISNRVARGVPTELRTVSSHIDHESKDWFNDLVKALEDVFPEQVKLIKTKRFQHNDLSKIDKTNRKYTPKRIESLFFSKTAQTQNNFSATFRTLSSTYAYQDNDKNCSLRVHAHLKNERYDLAQNELNDYLDQFNITDDLNYHLLILRLLIVSKSKSLEDFFSNRIQYFDDYHLLSEIIKKIPEGNHEEILTPLSDFIINSIKNQPNENTTNLYKLIIDINTDIVNELRNSVFSSLSLLKKQPDMVIELAKISIPYIATNNLSEFIDISTQLSSKFIEHGLFDIAQFFVDQVLSVDVQNSRCQLNNLLIKYKAISDTQLLDSLSQANEYIEITNLVRTLNESGVNKLIHIIKKKVNQLIDEGNYTIASNWIESFLARTQFEQSDIYYRSIIEKCLNLPDSSLLFKAVTETIDENNFEYFFKVNLEFIRLLINHKKYKDARMFCRELIEYDMTNHELLNLYLFAELESPIGSYKNINNLKEMTIIELMYHAYKTESQQLSVLINFMDLCIGHVSNNLVSAEDNIFNLFDALVEYTPKLSEKNNIIKRIHLFTAHILRQGLFKIALDNYEALLDLNENDHAAYWGVYYYPKTVAENEQDLIDKHINIKNNKEYEMAIARSNDDNAAQQYYLNWYSKVLENQSKLKKNNSKVILQVIIVVVIFVVTLMIIREVL